MTNYDKGPANKERPGKEGGQPTKGTIQHNNDEGPANDDEGPANDDKGPVNDDEGPANDDEGPKTLLRGNLINLPPLTLKAEEKKKTKKL